MAVSSMSQLRQFSILRRTGVDGVVTSKRDSSTHLPGSTKRRPGSPVLCADIRRQKRDEWNRKSAHSAQNDSDWVWQNGIVSVQHTSEKASSPAGRAKSSGISHA